MHASLQKATEALELPLTHRICISMQFSEYHAISLYAELPPKFRY